MKLNSGRFWIQAATYAGIATLALIASLAFLYFGRFDAQKVEQAIQQEIISRGYQVKILGSIHPQILPYPGVDIKNVQIFDPKNTNQAIVTIGEIKAEMSWWPILIGDNEIHQIYLTDLSAKIIQDTDGQLNINRLLMPNSGDSAIRVRLNKIMLSQFKIDYSSDLLPIHFKVNQGNLVLRDMLGPSTAELSGQIIESKHLANFALKTPYRLQKTHLIADKIDGVLETADTLTGEASLKLSTSAILNLKSLSTQFNNLAVEIKTQYPSSHVRVTIPTLNASFSELRANTATVSGQLAYATRAQYNFTSQVKNLSVTQQGTQADDVAGQLTWQYGSHKLNVRLNSPLQLSPEHNLRMAPLQLSSYLITPSLPRGQLTAGLNGELTGNLDQSLLNLRAQGNLDGSPFSIAIQQEGFIEPKHQAALQIDSLDLNRYLPETKPEQAVALFNNNTPLKLDWMDLLHLKAKVQIGNLTMGRFGIKDINVSLEAKKNELAIDNLSANIYQGQLTGSAKLRRGRETELEIHQQLHGMNIHPVLQDLFNFNRIEGIGSGHVNLKAHGISPVDLKNTLTGDVEVSLKNGALTGIDLVAALKNLPAELKNWNETSLVTNSKEKTTFSALSATFNLDNGVARNQNMRLASSLVDVNGFGKIDLTQSIIDYTLDVKANPKTFQTLQNINVPIKITGQINSPTYALDFNAIVKGKKTEIEKRDALKKELSKQIGTILQ